MYSHSSTHLQKIVIFESTPAIAIVEAATSINASAAAAGAGVCYRVVGVVGIETVDRNRCPDLIFARTFIVSASTVSVASTNS
jgi:hypothetical protein